MASVSGSSLSVSVSLYSPRSPTIPLLSPPPGSSLWSPLDVLRSYCIRGVPGWSHLTPQQIHLTQMKKGMTNQLFIAERMGGAGGEDGVDGAPTVDVFERVVVRVFGADTSTFFDREYEEYITRRLSKRGVGSRILTEFGSGRIEAFLMGRTLECDDLSDPRISFLAAKALATLHSKHIPITAQLIDNAKKKVQRDARKLLPLHAINASDNNHRPHHHHLQPAAAIPRLARVAEDGAGLLDRAEAEVGAASSPPSSPSRSFSSSLSPSELLSAFASASQPTSPLQSPMEGAGAYSLLPPLPSAVSSAGVSYSGHSHNSDGEEGVGYQEPLLYFRIHHWFQVARRLDFPEEAREVGSGGQVSESDGGGGGVADVGLDSFHLTSPSAAGEGSAASKRRLFLSLQLDSPRVEAEEQWLIAKLHSLHSPIVFCLSEDTEVLTDRGFMSRAKVFAACPELAPSSPTAAPASDSAPLPFGGAVFARTVSPLYWTPSPAEMEADAAAGITYEQLTFGGTAAAQLRDLAGRYGRRCAVCKKTVWSSVKKGAYTLMRKHTRSAHPAESAQHLAPAAAPRTGRVPITNAASASRAEEEVKQQLSQPGPRAAPPATSLRFASLDPSTGHLVYLPATALVWKTVASLVEFIDAGEAPNWAEDADEYGLTPDQVVRMEARSARARSGERLEKEEHFRATCYSNGVSLRVDRMHDMYVRVGMADTVQVNWADDYVKVKAGSLLSDDARQRVRMTGQATAGFDASAVSDDELPFIAALGLSAAQIDTFLWLYGYWLGDGHLDVNQRAVAFSPKKPHDKDEVKKRLEALGFTVPSDAVRVYPAANDQLAFRVLDARWVEYFFGEYGPKYGVASVSSSRPHTHTGLTTPLPKSVKWFWIWVWRLRKARARRVVAGLRYADGEEANDIHRINTSGVEFRDDLMRLALHAGYAASFDIRYKAGDHRGYTESGEPFEAGYDNWDVNYSDWPQAAEPVLYNQRDIKEVKEPTGAPVPVWCVTVPPHHLIIARRVRKNASGVVTLASKPVVVGNCHNDLQEGNLILEEKLPKPDRRRRKQSRKAQQQHSHSTDHNHHTDHHTAHATADAGTSQLPTSHPAPPSSPSTTEDGRPALSLEQLAPPPIQRERALSSPSTISASPAPSHAGPNGRERAAAHQQPHRPSSTSAVSLVIDVTGQRDSYSSTWSSLSASRWREAAEGPVSSDISYEELQRLMNSPTSPTSPDQKHSNNAQHHALNTSTRSPSSDHHLATSSHSPPLSFSSSPYSGWRLHMIDFEYSSYNPRGFDLGNHACEHYIDYSHSAWPGFAIKPQHFPSDLHLTRLLQVYLTHYRHLTKDPAPVTAADVSSALEETLWFTLASHFKWAMWAVVQAKRSEIHFGYMEYAVQRMQQYYEWKGRLTRRFTAPTDTTATNTPTRTEPGG